MFGDDLGGIVEEGEKALQCGDTKSDLTALKGLQQ